MQQERIVVVQRSTAKFMRYNTRDAPLRHMVERLTADWRAVDDACADAKVRGSICGDANSKTLPKSSFGRHKIQLY